MRVNHQVVLAVLTLLCVSSFIFYLSAYFVCYCLSLFMPQVVHKVGLCIALWDIQQIEDAYIFPGDGSHHSVVHFRYVVFRPFMDEILTGKIKGCSKEGVHG